MGQTTSDSVDDTDSSITIRGAAVIMSSVVTVLVLMHVVVAAITVDTLVYWRRID
ncbi:hypothetical protein OB955_01055 [Halobacteria archaeon AArc-m2/3/4]|uniref:Transmembrane protein n=1 Tax=Natronoglomus mannanivorans TaxID=2979990 RepID=A0ABT2Q8R8_9EURY|nr:hypothetical protein [Halobacteria archaeon AArc-m2/3/4]